LFVPAAVALAVTLGFFLLTGNWTNLGNPIASVVATLGGVAGFAVGAAPFLRRAQRSTTPDQAPP
jgi:hypothetical protein